jgi:hypothetical protein
MKADLHMHGPIGFQEHWIRMQGYARQSRLELLADVCRQRHISICALISEETTILKGSVHDRFWAIAQDPIHERGKRTFWNYTPVDENVFVVEKEGWKTYVVNSQAVITKGQKHHGHIVVGSNQVPNMMTLDDTLNYCDSKGYVQILQLPFDAQEHEAFLTHAHRYDAIEGHNAQLVLPWYTRHLPVVGNTFGKYAKTTNKERRKHAQKLGMPFVAVSDAHLFEHIGCASIELDEKDIDFSKEKNLLATLKRNLQSRRFTPCLGYAPFRKVIEWNMQVRVKNDLNDRIRHPTNFEEDTRNLAEGHY